MKFSIKDFFSKFDQIVYISEYTNIFPFVLLGNHIQNSFKYLR